MILANFGQFQQIFRKILENFAKQKIIKLNKILLKI